MAGPAGHDDWRCAGGSRLLSITWGCKMTETIMCGAAVITFLAGGVQFFVIKPTKMFSTLQISVIDLAEKLTALNGNIARLQECIEKFSKWVSNELRALDARVSVLEKHNEILENRIKELERRMNHAE